MKTAKRPIEPLDREEIQRLLATCHTTSWLSLQDKAIIVLFWRGQLRCAEALDLQLRDVDFERGVVRVRRGKGNKSRVVVLDDRAMSVLALWIEKWGEKFQPPTPLFCTRFGNPLLASHVRRMMTRRGRRAGIQKRVHAHGLRHTGACEMLEDGVSLMDIRDQLGHVHVSTTDQYLRTINPQRRQDVLRDRAW